MDVSYDLDCREFSVGSLDFIKGCVVSEFTAQLLLIRSLKPLKMLVDCNYLTELGSCIHLQP